MFIDGEFRQAKKYQKIINPATQEVIAEAGICDKADIDAALDAARTAFDCGPWKEISFPERKDFLLKISQGILEKSADLARIETQNSGKPIKETTFMDVPSAAGVFKDFAENFQQYLKEETLNVSSDASSAGARLLRQPQGVVVLIVPWNYPLLIASWKLAQALAAGNSVILKPSSLTPLSALELAKIIKQAGLPKGVFNLVNGPGSEIGEMLCADRRVDMISFTGSNESGRKILEYSSRGVKKLIMELGGKSASLILKDADFEASLNCSLCSIFLNQGQMCTGMSRIFVDASIYDNFVRAFVDRAKRIKLGPGLDYETQMGPLISGEQRKKVIACVQKAKKEGAKLLCGGKIPDEPSLKDGFFFEPTVFTGVTGQMSIFKEEAFGPVVLINKFSGLDEAVNLANQTDFGLAASIWTSDIPLAQDLSKKITAGVIWINTYGMFYSGLPYGGFKQSGFGKELGKEGFLEYTRLKNVITDNTKDSKPLPNYWYGF